MSDGYPAGVLRHLRRMAHEHGSDRELLERFAALREEAAFVELVRRHGAMVLGVCRRVLHDHHEAEDAFQATFLILARKAATIRRREALGSWLYGVAYHLALRLRRGASRRSDIPSGVPTNPSADPVAEVSGRELLQILDEELQRLPEKYRAPLVLCYLEGRTQDEAARQLGWTKDTLRGRVDRGRERLRSRLARRGLALSGALLATAATTNGVSAGLAGSTVRAAVLYASKQAIAGAVAAPVMALMEGAMNGMFATKLKVMIALLLAVSVATGAGALAYSSRVVSPAAGNATTLSKPVVKPADDPKREEQSQARTDLYGDPLPDDALARLGTVRLRLGSMVRQVGLFPDGKTLIAADWHGVHLWEATTGKSLRRFGDPRGRQFQSIAFSADGRTVALTMSQGDVEVWDAAVGEKRVHFQAGRFPGVLLSLDGKMLALQDRVEKDNLSLLRLLDAGTGKELHRLGETQSLGYAAAFSADGKTLVETNFDGGPIRFWDVTTGKPGRQFEGHSELLSYLTLSPDGRTLAAVPCKKFEGPNARGYMPGRLVLVWDVDAGKVVHRLECPGNQVQALAFTPNGKALLVVDLEGIGVWDVASGKEIPGRRLPVRMVGALGFSADGRTLATGGMDQTVRLWDLETGKSKLPLAGHQGTVRAVVVAPDGRTLATGDGGSVIHLWEWSTGKESGEIRSPTQGVFPFAYTPDGRVLVSRSDEGTTRVWDVAAGKERFRVPDVLSAALAPDGKTLVTAGRDQEIRVWDPASGQELRHWPMPKGRVGSLAVSPKGETLFCRIVTSAPGEAETSTICAWDLASGKEVRRFPGHPFTEDVQLQRTYCVTYSPDGRYVAFGGQVSYIALYDLATGKELKRLTGLPGACSALAFSPDSRLLASGDWTGGTFHLWEVATGQHVKQFAGHQGRVYGLAFSADGTVLVSGNEDTTALVWDLTGLRTQPTGRKPPSGPELDALWADLTSDDVARAQRAVHLLAAAPDQSIPYLRKQLQAVRPGDDRLLARLIAELDSEDFATRERATTELEKQGAVAVPALRRALTNATSAEVRARIKVVLDKVDPPSGQRWRLLRAIQALEETGGKEAQEVLRVLAQGDADAWLTQEAKASLERLARLHAMSKK